MKAEFWHVQPNLASTTGPGLRFFGNCSAGSLRGSMAIYGFKAIEELRGEKEPLDRGIASLQEWGIADDAAFQKKRPGGKQYVAEKRREVSKPDEAVLAVAAGQAVSASLKRRIGLYHLEVR